jgi:hypothetical protein
VGLTILHKIIVFDVSHIQTECGKYQGIVCGILSVPQNTIMDPNNVMLTNVGRFSYSCATQLRVALVRGLMWAFPWCVLGWVAGAL